MTGERPDDAQRPEDTAGTGDGTDGLEARRASDADAPFHGLRSAADIFGAPRSAEEWPSRRERREAIKAAQEKVSRVATEAGGAMYAAAQAAGEGAAGAEGGPAGGSDAGASDDTVVDAEVVDEGGNDGA